MGASRRVEAPETADAILDATIRLAARARRARASPGGEAMDDELTGRRLEALRTEHRDLDAALTALTAAGSTDQLQLARLKKRKLRLRDEIALIEDQAVPDIIA